MLPLSFCYRCHLSAPVKVSSCIRILHFTASRQSNAYCLDLGRVQLTIFWNKNMWNHHFKLLISALFNYWNIYRVLNIIHQEVFVPYGVMCFGQCHVISMVKY